jgi:cytochrome b561
LVAIKGSNNRYGGIAIGLHWTAAMAIPALLALGFAAAYVGKPNREVDLVRVHVVLGIAVLLLTLYRAVWWSLDQHPSSIDGQPAWQRHLARAVHLLLYAVPIIAGLSGIGLMILSKAASVLFLGEAGRLPRFTDFAPMTVHAIAAFALIALIGIHVAAALFHHFCKRDRLLARMGVGRETRSE